MRNRQTMLAVGILLACSLCGNAQEKPAAPKAPATIGWRQNWTGVFPDANPPTVWGRTLKNSLVKGLKVQVKKPDGDKIDPSARAIPDGNMNACIVIGPLTPSDAAKGLDQEFIAGEGDVQPSEGEKTGDQTWTFLKQDRPNHDHTDFNPLPLYRVLSKPKPGDIAYACAYVYSEKSGKVALMLDHTAGCKLWVNGKVVHNNPAASLGFWWAHGLSKMKLNLTPQPKSQRLTLDLNKGWNRFLFKVSAMEMEWGRGWAFLPRFIDIPPVAYDDKNILWTTKLPDTSNANLILVGDRIFLVSEQDELICISKQDGKVLWHRFNNYYEATPKVEREKEPVFQKVEPLMEQLYKEGNPDKRLALQRLAKELLTEADEKKYGMIVEDHPASHYIVTGFTTPTPCSDGKFVYVWFTHGVAACYDLDGNRKWIKRIDNLVKDPKDQYGPYMYPQGCVLSEGKFILWDKEAFALEAKTGEILWREPKFSTGMGAMPVVLNGVPLVMGYCGAARVSDGKVVWEGPKVVMPFGSGGGTFADKTFYMPFAGGVSLHVYDFSDAKGETLQPVMRSGMASTPEENRQLGDDYFKQGEWKDMFLFSAPLYLDGLVYIVGCEGVLYVMDAKTVQRIYRQKLPLDALVSVRAVGVCAPVAAAGKYVYVMDNQGGTVVFEPGRTYKQVALNRIETFVDRPHTGDGWQECTAYGAPVFEGNRLYIRGEGTLYCVEQK